MPEPIARYEIEITGLRRRHRFVGPEGEVGVLELERNALGLVVAARFSPARGEPLAIRRDPGLLRSQYSIWTEGREWLGSSLRWHLVRREIVLHTGSRPLRLVPLSGFRAGWSLQAPRSGEVARIHARPFGRRARIEIGRKVDFELVLFAYFLGSRLLLESLWPGPAVEEEPAAASAPSR